MTDETGTETPQPASEPTEGTRLRQERDAAVAQAKAMRSTVIDFRLEQMGLNPNEGIGVAIKDSFKGDHVTVEALRQHAIDKRYMTFEEPVEPERVTEPAQRIEGITTASTPVEPPPQIDPVVAAEQALHAPEGATREQAQGAMATKMARYRQMRQTGQIVPE